MIDGLGDAQVRAVLEGARVIGLVGYSDKPDRASNGVARFLAGCGYRVIPVNPGLAGRSALGETIVASIADLPPETDMVDLFRNSQAAGEAAAEALAALPNLRAIWMQLGVVHAAAAQAGRAAGVTVVMDRCPKIEMPRLGLRGPGG